MLYICRTSFPMPLKGVCPALEDENLGVTVKEQRQEAMVYNLQAALPPGIDVEQMGGISNMIRLLGALGYQLDFDDGEEEDENENEEEEESGNEEEEVDKESEDEDKEEKRGKRKREEEGEK